MRPFPAGYRLAVVSGPLQKIPAKDVIPRSISRGQSVDVRRGCLEARFTSGSDCFSIHRRIGSHLMATETGERDAARLTATTGHEAPGNPS
jgi:hypothetical protein